MMKSGFTLVEIMIVLAIIGLVVNIAVPAFLRNRDEAQGITCNTQLEQIYYAKEQLAFKLNVKPGAGNINEVDVLDEDINAYMRGFSVDDGCPAGGVYVLGTLARAADAAVRVPVCLQEDEIPYSGGTYTYGEQGLHIHRRSFLQNEDGTFARDNVLFAYGDE